MDVDLRKVLHERWGCRISVVHPVEEEEGRQCCRVESDRGPLFVKAHFYHQLYYLANSLGRGDYDFIRRMGARLRNWNGGVLEQLIKIAMK